MKYHKEGTPSIIIALTLAAGLIALAYFNPHWWWTALAILGLGLAALILHFFRNPARPISSPSDSAIFAPADGKVVVIEKAFEPEYFKEERLLISIFMSPLNVHVNRAPIGGKYAYAKAHPGKYLVAWHPKSSTENDRTTIVIEGKKGTVLLRQIAGALARRIVMYAKPEQKVDQGEELGFIKFGSRVDVYLPLNAKINVELEQSVQGNIDVIAELV